MGGGDTDKCMPRNPSIGRYSDDVKVCIGFYLDSYSLQLVNGVLCQQPVICMPSYRVDEISATSSVVVAQRRDEKTNHLLKLAREHLRDLAKSGYIA